ncbi:hypothetical protein Goklo_006421, partial [Gossypium klotzschianum]|nr:hypothetical protein [Gossypium klotzschianum]
MVVLPDLNKPLVSRDKVDGLTSSKLMQLTLLQRHDHVYRLAQIKGLRSMGLGCWLVGDQGGIIRIIRKERMGLLWSIKMLMVLGLVDWVCKLVILAEEARLL